MVPNTYACTNNVGLHYMKYVWSVLFVISLICRAKLHGWHDTYVFTKAMGEMVINALRGDIPVVTMRPSVIESTLNYPFPGWIQGNRLVTKIVNPDASMYFYICIR